MKVCHIIPYYYTLYAAPYEYTRKLASLGIDVDVIAFGRREEASHENLDGVSVVRIPLGISQRFSAKNSYKFVSAILRHLTGNRYDLVHVYSFRGCGLLPILGYKFALHWLLDIRTGNVSSVGFRSNLANRVTALESLAFGTCVVLDKRVGRRVLGLNRSFHVLPLGADFEKFKPARNQALRTQLGIDEDKHVIIYIGRLDPHRLIGHVLQGFAQAVKEYPNLLLLMVGDGVMRGELQLLAEELGITDQAKFTGYVPYDYIQDYVAVGDIGMAYVPITPQFDLQPPLKTVEFLASGLPTIATHTQGNTVFIRDGKNGLLVSDEPDALAEGILRLVYSPKLRQKLARNARSSVVDYDWRQIVAGRLLPIYKQLLEGVN